MVTETLEEKLQRMRELKAKAKSLDREPNSDIMTSEGGQKDADINQRPSDYRTESTRLSQANQPEGVQANVQTGTERVRREEGESHERTRRESNAGRDTGRSSLGSGNQTGDSTQRVTPKDIILNESSDIGYNASPVVKWDANIAAIKTLKAIESKAYGDREATSDEQKILSRYSGFGDSAFGQAFPANEDYRYDKDSPWGRRRDELKAITTPEEFKAIEHSRENAFYTTPQVIKTMWSALDRAGVSKLNKPRILEPSAGSGRFFGYQPPDQAAKSERVAVELDSLTGRMLKQMYPEAEVYNGIGFERAPIQKESIDVAISNVPFGNVPVFDPTFKGSKKKLTHSIHNYFFGKTLEELRPGGLLAFITSHQTLDAPSSKPIRQELAKDADLVEAIRLPDNAFPDTQVVTDIIIMRKRKEGEKPGNQDWVDAVQVPYELENSVWDQKAHQYIKSVNLPVNKYFIDHPDQVLGIPSAGGTMRRGAEYTVEAPKVPLEGLLEKSIQRIPPNIIEEAPHRPPTKKVYTAGKYHEHAHIVQDGQVFIQHGESMEPANLTSIEEDKIKKMLAIRDAEREAINVMSRNGSAVELEAAQKQLNDLYKEYVLANGPLSAPKNASLLDKDPDAPFLKALENDKVFRKSKDKLTEADKRLIKVLKGTEPLESSDLPEIQTDIFSKRVIHGYTEKPVTDYADAESVVKNETGRLDIPLMADKLHKTEQEVIDGLVAKNLIYKNPEGDWEPADRYLTGDVRGKLKVAEAAAAGRPKEFKRNVEALKAVQPEDIPASQIGVRMGAPWIPASDINQFSQELFDSRGVDYYRYNAITGEWSLDINTAQMRKESNRSYNMDTKLTEQFGTQKYPAHKIIEAVLNGQLVEVNKPKLDENGNTVTRTTKSGKVEVVMERDDKETIAAQEKAKIIQDKFQEWIWSDPDRTERLAKDYNDKFNNYRPRIFDGAHQALPGISEKWSKWTFPHQKDAIWRVVQEPNTLLAHEVGFGKTAVMVISGMERRRLGLSQKPIYVVPKTTHEQFKDQFLDIYPYANVLYPEKDDFQPEKRQEFVSRIATGDHDAVILSYEQFEKIPVKPETEERYLQAEQEELKDAIMQEIAANKDPDKKTPTQKELEKVYDRNEVKLRTLNQKIRDRSDKTIYFDDLGVDQLYVDEADNFKNLHFTTRMGRVKGLPNGKAERAWDMYTKTRLLHENDKNGIVFATGTPIANTIAEMYTMQRYLQPKDLEEKGLNHFDAWAKTFGETTESIEQTPTGQYKMTQRFAKFQNAPELSRMWQQTADIRVADEVPEMVAQRPFIINEKGEKNKREVVAVPPTPALGEYMKTLAERADNLKGPPIKGGDNMLKIAGDARKASLDLRLVDPKAVEDPNGKVNVACSKIAQIYNEPFTKANKGTQLVFLDMGTPKAKPDDEKPPKEVKEGEEFIVDDDNEETPEEQKLLKDVYSNIKKQLIANGIPEKEIAFIHDAKTEKQRTTLFESMNNGDIRVLIGSTGKMGAGVNVQTRAAALHHLDAPWRPRDIEQREGRVIRQGNKVYGPKKDADGKVIDLGKGVKIYTYVTEKSFDAFMWQAIEVKSKAIKSIMRRSAPPRAIEDVDSFTMSAGEAKAIASGDPDVMKAVTLKNNVTRFQMLKSSALDSKIRAQAQLKRIPEAVTASREVMKTLEASDKLVKSKGEKFEITVDGKTYQDNKESAVDVALRDAIVKKVMFEGYKDGKIGEYKGFDVVLEHTQTGPRLSLKNDSIGASYPTSNLPGTVEDVGGKPTIILPSDTKILTRMDNSLRDIGKSLETRKQDIAKMEVELKTYQAQADKPFEYEERLNKMQAELDRLEKKLQGQKVEDTPSDNYIEEPMPEDNEPSYHYGDQEINPKAEIEAVKAEIQPVEKELEVKAPPANIEKIVEKIAEPVKGTAVQTTLPGVGPAPQVQMFAESSTTGKAEPLVEVKAQVPKEQLTLDQERRKQEEAKTLKQVAEMKAEADLRHAKEAEERKQAEIERKAREAKRKTPLTETQVAGRILGNLPSNNLIESNGHWFFAGQVDSRLAYSTKDGKEPSPEQIKLAQTVGSDLANLKRRTWDSKEAALESLRQITSARVGQTESRGAHNAEIAGSTPAPATKTAYEYGVEGFKDHKVAAQNKEFMDKFFAVSRPVGSPEGMKALKDYNDGYQKAAHDQFHKAVLELKETEKSQTAVAIPNETLTKLREINAQRRPQAVARDIKSQNKVTIEYTDPRVKRWEKHPGSMDVLGVDTPSGVTKPTSIKIIKPEKHPTIIKRGSGMIKRKLPKHIISKRPKLDTQRRPKHKYTTQRRGVNGTVIIRH